VGGDAGELENLALEGVERRVEGLDGAAVVVELVALEAAQDAEGAGG
jgi:hypothetical protein